MPPSVKVTGTCPKCGAAHQRTAVPGRKTWRGTCNRNGCDGQIFLRMARTPAPPADPGTPAEPAAPPAPTKKGVVRGDYQRRPGNTRGRPGGDVPPPAGADRTPDGRPDQPPTGDPVDERVVRQVEPETGNSGRHPYAHLPYFG